jgi:ATP-binding cassette, subfamily B, bacterial MsbA
MARRQEVESFERVNEQNRRLNMKLASAKAASEPVDPDDRRDRPGGVVFVATREDLAGA